jgi:hypothetical protein
MKNPVSQPHVPWLRVVELAKELDSTFFVRREVSRELALRLAHAVLEFQQQLLGDGSEMR